MHRKHLCLSFALVLLLAVPALSAERVSLERDRFELDSAHSKIGFSIDFMGLTKVEGRFTRYSGTMLFDEDDPTQSSISVAIRVDSIDTANDFRDHHLKSPDFFDAEKFPYILFRSTRVEKDGDALALVGDLTLHGVTKEVRIPFRQLHGRMKDMWDNTRVGFQGKLVLDRRNFHVVGPERVEHSLDLGRLTIGNEVEITLNIQGRIWNWDKIGFSPKSIAAPLQKALEENGVEAAVRQYHELKQSGADGYDWGESGLNILGYKLLYSGKKKEAIEILKLNVAAFPQSANVYDSLGEAYAIAGDREHAVASYEKSLELDPYNANAMEMLRYFGAGPSAAAARE